MTEKEYRKYKQIALKICSNDDRTEDLLHDVLIQLSTNEKFKSLDEKKKTFFFVRAISNQFYSNNSYFFRQFNKFKWVEFDPQKSETEDKEYMEKPTLEWVYEELNKELEKDKNFWYNKGLFEMYLNHKKIETVHRLTMIPKHSIRETLNEVKTLLKQKWDEYDKIG